MYIQSLLRKVFKWGCFITVLWTFLMTAQCETLTMTVIRPSVWNKWIDPSRRMSLVKLGPLDNNWLRESNCIIRAIIDWMDFILLSCLTWDHCFIISSKTKMAALPQKANLGTAGKQDYFKEIGCQFPKSLKCFFFFFFLLKAIQALLLWAFQKLACRFSATSRCQPFTPSLQCKNMDVSEGKGRD